MMALTQNSVKPLPFSIVCAHCLRPRQYIVSPLRKIAPIVSHTAHSFSNRLLSQNRPSHCTSREEVEFDVVIVGGGPAGLATAIRLKQRAPHMSVCVVDKGRGIGDQVLSGACINITPLLKLVPKKELDPLLTPITSEKVHFLTRKHALRMPVPWFMRHKGEHMISLCQLTRLLARIAEESGVDLFPGFAGVDLLFDKRRLSVQGVVTGNFGIAKDGTVDQSRFVPGLALRASLATVLADGSLGNLSQQAISHFRLQGGPQRYALGIKEIWKVPDSFRFRPGTTGHFLGYPFDTHTLGGGFLYHLQNNMLAVGLSIGLDYRNPHLSPFHMLHQFKQHPHLAPFFEKATCVEYGAKTIPEGGIQSLPRLSFPGGVLVGDSAGFVNFGKLQGIHTALQSGILAAESISTDQTPVFQKKESPSPKENTSTTKVYPISYDHLMKSSSLWKELFKVRNLRPSFRFGLLPFLLYSGLEAYIFRGRAPFTFRHLQKPDRAFLSPASKHRPISYPNTCPTRLDQLQKSNLCVNENQPSHIKVTDPYQSSSLFAYPETRYCPAQVFELDPVSNSIVLQPTNCLHCKTCEIKDPFQNYKWTPPEGGNGPTYMNM